MDIRRDSTDVLKASAAHTITYRPDIDGLRAVAVGLVVLFHAWPKWLRSGFIGVDVFFVISGFLITSIILKDLKQRSFTIRGFYVRRIRRIFPALITVVLAVLAFGWYVLLQQEFAQLGKHVAAAAAFVSNLVLWSEAGYWDNESVTKPLLHLWSLGVEEQFYLVWPIAMALCFRVRFGILAFLALTLAGSFLYGLYATFNHPAEAYFSPVTRFWELASGGLVAYAMTKRSPLLPAPLLISSLGLLLLVLGAVLIKGQADFPGAWALLPVLGTCALIAAGNVSFINRRLLGNPLMVKVGLVSYPFYLWHWPLLSFGYIIEGEKPEPLVKAALVLAALALAFLTYHLIERPVQKSPNKRRAIQGLVAAMACFGVLGVMVKAGLLQERMPSTAVARYMGALNDLGFPDPAMKPLRYNGSLFQQLDGRGQGTTVLIGDSVMEQYAPLVAQGLREGRFDRSKVIFATQGGCMPVEGSVRLPRLRYPTCTTTVTDAWRLAASPEVDTVVVAASWYGYFANWQQDVQMPVDGQLQTFPAASAHEAAYATLQQSIARLRAAGKRVYLILQPPSGNQFDPRSMITGSRFGEMKPRTDMEPYRVERFYGDNAAPRQRLLQIAQATGTLPIDPVDTVCKDGICPTVNAQGEPIYTDPVHMRPFYVKSRVHYLDPALNGTGKSVALH
ncbi:O-acetyltransferase OatA [Massilia sp. Bi118]|uniref:acyltransferase family protein n=1 Tax=Massilia sp. Bi118 TaxID=2822346 RepID=UPI001D4A353C|nr:acyltransferase family protein [Massilia sp. Bi118]CAH0273602.1 O-acetyltransferase OatA [Massilia sp. Bi118]